MQRLARELGLHDLTQVLADFGDPFSARAIVGLNAEQLIAMENEAASLGEPLRHPLVTFWYLDVTEQPDPVVDALVAALRDLSEVPIAYREIVAVPAAVSQPVIEPNLPQQPHLRPGTGLNVQAAWTTGSRPDGANVRLVCIDAQWNPNHEELAGKIDHLFPPKPPSALVDDHGTKAIGLAVAKQNRRGGIGVAPEVSWVGAVSYGYSGGAINVTDVASGISQIAWLAYSGATVRKGDVLLIEAQTDSNLPIEYEPLAHSAIFMASLFGLVVIEPAGNNWAVLDNLTNAIGVRIWSQANGPYWDSRAIMVGATREVGGVLSARPDSNKGWRVNCCAPGEALTCGMNGTGGNINHQYAIFERTSCASAIIAGAALLLQDASWRSHGNPASAATMRSWLADVGTGIPVPHVGTMPQLDQIMAAQRL